MIATTPEVRAQEVWGPGALSEVREARRCHQQAIAPRRDEWIRSNRYFYDRLKRVLQFIVEPGKRVLEVRCETGHLLASVKPSHGVGVEISDAMVESARRQHPDLHFVKSDPETLELNETFDYILFNHIFDTVDILRAFESIRRHCTAETQIVVINYNQLWEPMLRLASKVGLRSRFVEPNWVSENDIRGFLKLAGFRPVRKHRLLLFPKWIPLLAGLLNGLLARLPGLRRLCLMQVMVARPLSEPKREGDVSVSVVIPCRNEAGNVRHAAQRIPSMGKHTELLFCDDKSTDGTAAEVRRLQSLYPEKDIRLIEGPGICKAENVWTGFRAAHGDVLNGSRLVYPMPHLAMKFANMLGNKFFGQLFSFLLDQRIKDTLCGTKVFWREDWLRMEPHLGSWGIKDLWGDYELLFGASKLHLEIVEVPVHYQERIHGVTKMTRVFANGLRMLRICWHAWYHLQG